MALPAIEAFRRVNPEIPITFLGRPWVVDLAPIRPGDSRIEIRDGGWRGGVRGARLAWGLRHSAPEVAVVLPESFSSAIYPFVGGVGRRIGYRSEGRAALLTDPIPKPPDIPKEHRTRRYLRLFEVLTGSELPVEPATLSIGEEASRGARELLADSGFTRRPFVAFAVGSRAPARRWPAEFFGELARRLAERWDAALFVLAAPDEREVARRAVESSGGALGRLARQTDISELPALLAQCDLLVANDSGVSYVGAAAGVPTFILCGAGDEEVTRPLGEHVKITRLDLDCAPCVKNVCPLGHNDCMLELTPDRIERELMEWPLAAGSLSAQRARGESAS